MMLYINHISIKLKGNPFAVWINSLHSVVFKLDIILPLSFNNKRKTKVKPVCRVRLFAALWPVAYQAPRSMGFFQARALEWVAISFSRGSSQPRDHTRVSHINNEKQLQTRVLQLFLLMLVLFQKKSQKECFAKFVAESMLYESFTSISHPCRHF